MEILEDQQMVKELEEAFDKYSEQDVRVFRSEQNCCGTLRCGTVGSVKLIVPQSSFLSGGKNDGFEGLQGRGHLLVLDTGDAVWSTEVQLLPKAETLQ